MGGIASEIAANVVVDTSAAREQGRRVLHALYKPFANPLPAINKHDTTG